MFLVTEWLLKGLALVVLGLLEILGVKRAGKWLDRFVKTKKDERPVV